VRSLREKSLALAGCQCDRKNPQRDSGLYEKSLSHFPHFHELIELMKKLFRIHNSQASNGDDERRGDSCCHMISILMFTDLIRKYFLELPGGSIYKIRKYRFTKVFNYDFQVLHVLSLCIPTKGFRDTNVNFECLLYNVYGSFLRRRKGEAMLVDI
jgi:hypothetical protein